MYHSYVIILSYFLRTLLHAPFSFVKDSLAILGGCNLKLKQLQLFLFSMYLEAVSCLIGTHVICIRTT